MALSKSVAMRAAAWAVMGLALAGVEAWAWAPPQLDSISPDRYTMPYAQATYIDLHGSGFATDAVAKWNSTALTTQYVNSTSLIATVPAGLVTDGTVASITVVSGGQTSNAKTFTVAWAPQMDVVSPAYCTFPCPDTAVVATGLNFKPATVVRYDNTPVATTYVSATQLKAVIPAALLNSDPEFRFNHTVSVKTGDQGGGGVLFEIRKAQTGPIRILSVTPASIPAGSPTVTLDVLATSLSVTTGNLLLGGGSGVVATKVEGTDHWRATIDAGMLTYPRTFQMSLNVPGYTSEVISYEVTSTLKLTGVTPESVLDGAAAAITVSGEGFVSDAVIRFNGNALATTWVSARELRATIPAGMTAAPGTYDLVVQNHAEMSSALRFTVLAGTPGLTAVAPDSCIYPCKDTAVTLTGTNFRSGATAYYDDQALATTPVSERTLQAVIPAAMLNSDPAFLKSHFVQVRSSGRTSGTLAYKIVKPTAPPQLDSISPERWALLYQVELTMELRGSGFGTDAVALWNATPLATRYVNSTSLVATVPASFLATEAVATVKVVSGGQTSNGKPFTVAFGPALDSLTPSYCTYPCAETLVTLLGRNFKPATVAKYDGKPLTTTYVSATQLTAVVPAALLNSDPQFEVGHTIGVWTGDLPSGDRTFEIRKAQTGPIRILSVTPASIPAGSPTVTLDVLATSLEGTSASLGLGGGGGVVATRVQGTDHWQATLEAVLLKYPRTFQMSLKAPGYTSEEISYQVTSVLKVSGIVPASAPEGSPAMTITISGDGFVSDARVLMDGTDLAVTWVSAKELKAAVPASLLAKAGTKKVLLINHGEYAPELTFTVTAVYPTLTGVTPKSCTYPCQETVVTLTGTHFKNGAVADYDRQALTTTYVSETTLQAVIPAALLNSDPDFRFSHTVGVTSDGKPSGDINFTILRGAKEPVRITSVVPESLFANVGPVTLDMTINTAATEAWVRFGSSGLPATKSNNGHWRVTLEPELYRYAARVALSMQVTGYESEPIDYEILPAPQLGGIAPAQVVAGSAAFRLKLTGTNFLASTQALWNGQPLETFYVSATELGASIPAGLVKAAGTASVATLTRGYTTPVSRFTITDAPKAPVLTQVAPAQCTAPCGEVTVTVSGTGFRTGAEASLDGRTLATKLVSETSLTALIPADNLAEPAPHVLTVAADGLVSGALPFTVVASAEPLTLLWITPYEMAAGSPATVLKVTEKGSTGPVSMEFDGRVLAGVATAEAHVWSVTVPAELLVEGRMATVRVLAGGQVSNVRTFEVFIAAPVLETVTPGVLTEKKDYRLDVTGKGFTKNTKVVWGITNLPTTYVNENFLQGHLPAALVPDSATGLVTAANGTRLSNWFQVPRVSSYRVKELVPAELEAGAADTFVALSVAGLNAADTLEVGGQAAVLELTDAEHARAMVPAAAMRTSGEVALKLCHASGVCAEGLQKVTVRPAVRSVAPASVLMGSGKARLTLRGAGLKQGEPGGSAAVVVKRAGATAGLELVAEVVDDTAAAVELPAEVVAQAGQLELTYRSGGGLTAAVTRMEITSTKLELYGVEPSTALAGTKEPLTLTVSGSGFDGTAAVRWNGALLATSYVGPSRLTAVVPEALLMEPRKGALEVVKGGSTGGGAEFEVKAWALSRLEPFAAAALGYPVTIQVVGEGFTAESVARWNGAPMATRLVSANVLSAAVPASALSTVGKARVDVAMRGGAVSGALEFTMEPQTAAPHALSLAPAACTLPCADTLVTVQLSYSQWESKVEMDGVEVESTDLRPYPVVTAWLPAARLTTAGPRRVRLVANGQTSEELVFEVQEKPRTRVQLFSMAPSWVPAGSAEVKLAFMTDAAAAPSSVTVCGHEYAGEFTARTGAVTVTLPAAELVSPKLCAVRLTFAEGAVGDGFQFEVTAQKEPPKLGFLLVYGMPAGSPESELLVFGSGFTRESVVWMENVALATRQDPADAGLLYATVPEALLKDAGRRAVQVRNGSQMASEAVPFIVYLQTPVVTLVRPATMEAGSPNVTVEVFGSGLLNGTDVTWGEKKLHINWVSDEYGWFIVPAELLTQAGEVKAVLKSQWQDPVELKFTVVEAGQK